jgi:hypothetical protein
VVEGKQINIEQKHMLKTLKHAIISNEVIVLLSFYTDNLINQKIITSVLTRLGYTDIDMVENGLLAAEKASFHTKFDENRKQYDIILMGKKKIYVTSIHIYE